MNLPGLRREEEGEEGERGKVESAVSTRGMERVGGPGLRSGLANTLRCELAMGSSRSFETIASVTES